MRERFTDHVSVEMGAGRVVMSRAEFQHEVDVAMVELVRSVMKYEKMVEPEAVEIVYGSSMRDKLMDPESGLLRESDVYLYDMLCDERGVSVTIH